MPPGHAIKCAKADGKTPGTNDEVAALNKDIADAKQTYGDTTGAVSYLTNPLRCRAGWLRRAAVRHGCRAPGRQREADPQDVKGAVSDTKQAYSDPGTVNPMCSRWPRTQSRTYRMWAKV